VPYPVTPESLEQLKGRTTGWVRDEETGDYTYITREPTGQSQYGELRKTSGVFAETPPEIIPMAERGQYGLPTTAEQPERTTWTPAQTFGNRREMQEGWIQQRWDNEYDLAVQLEEADPSRAAMIRENANEIRQIELQELNGWSNEIKVRLRQNSENRQLDKQETYFANEGVVRDAGMPIKQPKTAAPPKMRSSVAIARDKATLEARRGRLDEVADAIDIELIDMALTDLDQETLAVLGMERYEKTIPGRERTLREDIWPWGQIPEREVEAVRPIGAGAMPSPEMQLATAPVSELGPYWSMLPDEEKRLAYRAWQQGVPVEDLVAEAKKITRR